MDGLALKRTRFFETDAACSLLQAIAVCCCRKRLQDELGVRGTERDNQTGLCCGAPCSKILLQEILQQRSLLWNGEGELKGTLGGKERGRRQTSRDRKKALQGVCSLDSFPKRKGACHRIPICIRGFRRARKLTRGLLRIKKSESIENVIQRCSDGGLGWRGKERRCCE